MKINMLMKRAGGLVILISCMLPGISYSSSRTSLQVLSATVKDMPISGAEVIFQRNGQHSVSTRTDVNGKDSVTTPFGIDDSSVFLIIKAPGYSSLVVKCPCNGLTYALSKTMSQLDGMRIVLTWGAHPKDMDSHLVFPGNHIFFNHKVGEGARLDVDNVIGYGPETITIDRRIPGKRYLYAVHTYNDDPADNGGGPPYKTKAHVQVYVGSTLVRTYYFTPGAEDTLLVLFGINDKGQIYDINKTQKHVHGYHAYEAYNDQVSTKLRSDLNASSELQTEYTIDKSVIAHAKQLNYAGEKAYHRGDIDTAVDLYQQAIALYPGYGQAYSNLGLAFRKTHRIAEALWASRRSIVVATGNKRNVVRASSYYNIARIYESQHDWGNAWLNYKWAEEQHHNKVYITAIARMKSKLGR